MVESAATKSDTAEPYVRARFLKTILEDVGQLGESRKKAVLRHLGSSAEVVENARAAEWMPSSLHLTLMQAIGRELGDDEALTVYRASATNMMNTPLLNSLVRGAIKIIGSSPTAIIGLMPSSFRIICRDYCTWSVIDKRPNNAGLLCRDLHSDFGEEFVRAFAGHFYGILDLTDKDGSVVVREFDSAQRTALYEITWNA